MTFWQQRHAHLISLLLPAFLLLLSVPGFMRAQEKGVPQEYFVNAQLPWHKAVLDSKGLLLAWYYPEKCLGYDQFLRLDWNFLENKVPIDPQTGLKVYLIYAIFHGNTLQGYPALNWQHNPAGLYAHLMDMLVRWYPYSGDEQAKALLREMLDYQLEHGTTPIDWNWAGVPFATSCDGDKNYGRCLQDMPREFYGGIEPDKVGELGLAYVFFYEMTGDRRYLDAGLRCAEALAKHVRPGDATHTPWPFRVDGRTGIVLDGEEYGGMVVGPVRLFDELIRLEIGDVTFFKRARELAWKWVLNNPLNKDSAAWDRWSGYYEDVPKDTENENDMDSLMTAYYILSQQDPATVDPEWRVHVGHLLDRSRALLGRGPFFGAWAIDEQLRPDGGVTGGSEIDNFLRPHAGALLGTDNRGCCSRSGLVCRTAQWGAVNAMYYKKTDDGQALENAFRSLNYATYFVDSEGKISCCGADFPGQYWFEDGYADAGRSFTWALAAVPEFAPQGQNHLLYSSSVVQHIRYANHRVVYTTFDVAGIEELRLSFRPVKIFSGSVALKEQKDLQGEGYTVRPLPLADYVVWVRHNRSKQVNIEGEE
jgi:hypothetical protein